jgi:hypothetical protein
MTTKTVTYDDETHAIVPSRMTAEMVLAFVEAGREYMDETGGISPQTMYRAALAAAPEHPSDAAGDGDRYRFLREQPLSSDYPPGIYVAIVKQNGRAVSVNNEHLDAAIDAAIAAQKAAK